MDFLEFVGIFWSLIFLFFSFLFLVAPRFREFFSRQGGKSMRSVLLVVGAIVTVGAVIQLFFLFQIAQVILIIHTFFNGR